MINIVIPMSGRGKRFKDAGYKLPKPFINTTLSTSSYKPMIGLVYQNLIPHEPHRFIFIARRDHEDFIKAHMSFATDVIYVDEVTEGAACTVLLAKEFINNKDPLIVANCDQLIKWNNCDKVITDGVLAVEESNSIQDFINYCRLKNSSGISTFKSLHSKWSFAKLGAGGFVTEVAEKNPISDNATCGVYYFSSGNLFVRAAERMIAKNIRVNGEFYVCPVFNEIAPWSPVVIYNVAKMIGLGTPEDFESALEEDL